MESGARGGRLRAGAELTSLALAAYGTVVTLALTSDDDKLPLSAA